MTTDADKLFERLSAAAEERLRPRLTDEFLETVREAAMVVGWRADFYEVDRFIRLLYAIAKKPAPDNFSSYEFDVDSR